MAGLDPAMPLVSSCVAGSLAAQVTRARQRREEGMPHSNEAGSYRCQGPSYLGFGFIELTTDVQCHPGGMGGDDISGPASRSKGRIARRARDRAHGIGPGTGRDGPRPPWGVNSNPVSRKLRGRGRLGIRPGPVLEEESCGFQAGPSPRRGRRVVPRLI